MSDITFKCVMCCRTNIHGNNHSMLCFACEKYCSPNLHGIARTDDLSLCNYCLRRYAIKRGQCQKCNYRQKCGNLYIKDQALSCTYCHKYAGYLIIPITNERSCGLCYAKVTQPLENHLPPICLPNAKTPPLCLSKTDIVQTCLPCITSTSCTTTQSEEVLCFHCHTKINKMKCIGFCDKCCSEKNEFIQSKKCLGTCFHCQKSNTSAHILCDECKSIYYQTYSRQLDDYINSLPSDQSFYL